MRVAECQIRARSAGGGTHPQMPTCAHRKAHQDDKPTGTTTCLSWCIEDHSTVTHGEHYHRSEAGALHSDCGEIPVSLASFTGDDGETVSITLSVGDERGGPQLEVLARNSARRDPASMFSHPKPVQVLVDDV